MIAHFADNVVSQSERMHSTGAAAGVVVLEQMAAPAQRTVVELSRVHPRRRELSAQATRVGRGVVCVPNPATVVGDAEALQLALDNLLHNAIDFALRRCGASVGRYRRRFHRD